MCHFFHFLFPKIEPKFGEEIRWENDTIVFDILKNVVYRVLMRYIASIIKIQLVSNDHEYLMTYRTNQLLIYKTP